jgi:hypothetical protein
MVYDVSGDIDLFGVDGKGATLVAEAYTGRSSKRRGLRTVQREQVGATSPKESSAMALDPVPGHHHHYAHGQRVMALGAVSGHHILNNLAATILAQINKRHM